MFYINRNFGASLIPYEKKKNFEHPENVPKLTFPGRFQDRSLGIFEFENCKEKTSGPESGQNISIAQEKRSREHCARCI